MQIVGQAQKVTIYIGESDKWKGKPLYMVILEMLKAEDCAGATVTRAVAGFGAHSRIHTASLVDLSSDLPLIIEWVDNPARIERVMPRLRTMVGEGLIITQNAEVITYSHRRLRQLPANIPVQDIMSREVHSVRANTPLLDVIELLLNKTYRALPVVDSENRVTGIVTEANLLRNIEMLATSVQRQLSAAELAVELQRLQRLDHTVAKVMTPDPITVSGETSVERAVQQMVENNVKRLPVVDSDKKLIGIVSRVDVLRVLGQPPFSESPRPGPMPGHYRSVGEIMASNVPTVQADAPLTEIIGLLVGSLQRRVVVVDSAGRVVGLITDGDLISRATLTERPGIIHFLSRRKLPQPDAGFRLSERRAAEVMTSPVISVSPQTSLSEALHLLLTHHIKRLPVTDEEGKLLGLVGRGLILQAIARGTDPVAPNL